MKKTWTTLLALSLCGFAYSQGCIPVRNLVGFGQFANPEYDPLNAEPSKWLLNINSRYHNSFQTYDGSDKVHEEPGDLKENHTYIVNFSITRLFDNGWSYTLDIPFTAADRTTWQEHDATTKVRHTTRSFGISDIRLAVYKWLFDVSMSHKGNVQIGLGLKLPTGDYRYQDYFYKKQGKVMAPVNQTIQLGDGGTGISLEVNSFLKINRTVGLYGNAFYLINPRDQNGVSNTFGRTLDPANSVADANLIESGGNVNSVTDAYTTRVGANFTVKKKLVFWSGLRLEGQPVHDLVGGSNGQRRAGMILSFEPGINYQFKNTTFYTFAPLPIYRTTYQTVPDQILDQLDPSVSHTSPGGFANYMIFVGAVVRF